MVIPYPERVGKCSAGGSSPRILLFSEVDLHPHASYNRCIHIFTDGFDNLEVWCNVEPRGYGYVIVEFQALFILCSSFDDSGKFVTDGQIVVADPKVIVITTRNHPLAAESDTVKILNWVHLAVC